MRRPASSSLSRSALFAQTLAAGAAALLALACGGSTDTGLGSTGGVGGGGGTSSAGTGGSGGASAGQGGSSAGTGGSAPKVCAPAKQVSCPCPGAGNVNGVQVCNAEGTGYEACTGCPGSGGSGGSSGSGGSAGASTAGSGGAATSECGQCIDDKCQQQVAACEADPDCGPLYECVVAQCSESTSTTQLGLCAFQSCGANQQTGQKITPVAQCAAQQCKGACAFAGPAGGAGGAGGSGSGGTSSGGAGGASDPGAAPGVVNCGDQLSCDTATQGNCCIAVGTGGPQYSCSKDKCQGGFVNVSQPCDGPEDCPADKGICCGKFSGGASVTCSSDCKSGGGQQNTAYQLCHKNDDCAAPDTCQVCDVGQFGISLVVRVCGQQCPNQGGGFGN